MKKINIKKLFQGKKIFNLFSFFAFFISSISLAISIINFCIQNYEFQEERLPVWYGIYNEKNYSIKLESLNKNILIQNLHFDYYDEFSKKVIPDYTSGNTLKYNEIPLLGLMLRLKPEIDKNILFRTLLMPIMIHSTYTYKSAKMNDYSIYILYLNYDGKFVYDKIEFQGHYKISNTKQRKEILKILAKV